MKWWARAPLRAKIYLTFSALIATLFAGTVGFTRVTVDRQVEATLEAHLMETVQRLQDQREGWTDRLRVGATQLARDHALKGVVATYDPDSLQVAAENFRERIEADLFWVIDDSGILLADSERKQPVHASLSSLEPLRTAITREQPSDAMAAIDGRLFQLVAVPVQAPDLIGFIVAGKEVDDRTAGQLVARTESRISFLSEGTVFASSLPPDERVRLFGAGRLDPTFLEQNTGHTFLSGAEGERYQSLLLRIDSDLTRPLYVLVQRSYDQAVAPWNLLQTQLVLLGFAAVGVALAFGMGLARGITMPVQRLVGVMRQVLHGDLDQSIRVEREDEIGFLSRAFNEMVKGLRDRARIRDAFGRFVSEDVAEAYLAGRFPLEGERREVTILFQDIRDFTSLSERMEPEQVRRILNRIITEMVGAVEAEGGTVKQFTGDGLMAIFGAPKPDAQHPEHAVRAAISMTDRFAKLNEQFRAEGLESQRIGVGIHTGEVVAGPFGPDERLEYGVVGDTANLASRIESLTKLLVTSILISETTAARLGPGFRFGRRETHAVKGKKKDVDVVEVLGWDR